MLAPFGLWALFAIYKMGDILGLTPLKGVSLDDFVNSGRKIHHVYYSEVNGQTYTKVVGKTITVFALPSETPVYIFDADKKLVDWGSDENPNFNKNWGARQSWTNETGKWEYP